MEKYGRIISPFPPEEKDWSCPVWLDRVGMFFVLLAMIVGYWVLVGVYCVRRKIQEIRQKLISK